MKVMNLFAGVFALLLLTGGANAAIRTQYVDYMDGNTQLSGYLAYDDSISGKRPGVLLFHARGGMNSKTLADAEMIARMGYVVFAADMFGKGTLPKTVPEMTALTTIYNNDRPATRLRAHAGYDVLAANPMVDAARIVVIGYCFGGMVAVELAGTGIPAPGTVAVHGLFRNFDPAMANNIKGRFLILHGAEDTAVPLDEVNRFIADLRVARVNFELRLFSGAEHAFTSPRNDSEERAEREYKVAIQSFFKEIFGI